MLKRHDQKCFFSFCDVIASHDAVQELKQKKKKEKEEKSENTF